jgi:hypothetical protein
MNPHNHKIAESICNTYNIKTLGDAVKAVIDGAAAADIYASEWMLILKIVCANSGIDATMLERA